MTASAAGAWKRRAIKARRRPQQLHLAGVTYFSSGNLWEEISRSRDLGAVRLTPHEAGVSQAGEAQSIYWIDWGNYTKMAFLPNDLALTERNIFGRIHSGVSSLARSGLSHKPRRRCFGGHGRTRTRGRTLSFRCFARKAQPECVHMPSRFPPATTS